MTAYTFSPGHILGRAGGVDMAVKSLHALLEVVKAGVYQGEFSRDEEVNGALLLLVRLGFKECEDITTEIGHIMNIAREQEQRELAARKKEG